MRIFRSEHMREIEAAGVENVNEVQRKEFSAWFYKKVTVG